MTSGYEELHPDASVRRLDSRSDINKRVLFAVRYLWGNEGITTQLTALIKELKSRNWDVGLISGINPKEIDNQTNLKWLIQNTSHFYIPTPKHFNFSELYKFPSILYNFTHHIYSFKPSIIQVFSLSLTPYLYITRVLTGIRYISRVAVEPDPSKIDVKLGSIASRITNKYFGDYVIAISSDMVAPLRDTLKIKEDRICVILNGIDTTYFRPPNKKERTKARKTLNVSQESNVVSIVGRLHWIKGHDILFKAIKELKDDGFNPLVLCAGSGDHKHEIKDLADDLCITSQVKFLGYTDSRDVYWASDLLVLPSRREGFANVIAEGMLCGTIPIRTPGAGANDQIENGCNGFTVPYDDPQALADTIRYVITHPRKRQNMEIQAARTALERFSLESMVDKTEKLYLTLLD